MSSTVEEAGIVSSLRSTPGKFLAQAAPGLILCAAITVPAYQLARYSPSLDALALSFILGMIIRNALGPGAMMDAGVKLAQAVFVPAGILLYGTRLNFGMFANLPVFTSVAVLTCVLLFYTVILIGVIRLHINRRTGLLIASGTAICGASAIAVLAPVVGARSRETSIALIVTTTAGLMGAVLYPLIADSFSMSAVSYGLLCGSTLQQTGIVQLASSHLGEAATALAIPVKMFRIAMLAPITLILAVTVAFRPGPESRDSARGALGEALKRAWFLPLFIAVALIFSFFGPASALRPDVEPFAILFLSMALASIGLSVDFSSIVGSSSRPLMVGVLGWALVAVFFLVVLVPLLTLEG